MATTADQYLADLLGKAKSFDKGGDALKCMIYGESGVGKTVFAVELAKAITPPDKIIFYVDSGAGYVSLKNHPALMEGLQWIKAPYTTVNALWALAGAIESGKMGLDKVGTIVLDEGSTMSNMDLDAVVTDRAGKDPGKDPDTPTQPDYNTSGNRFRKVISDFVRLPGVNLIVVAHVRTDKNARGLETRSPSFLPKLSTRIREMLHIVGYLAINQRTDEEGNEVFLRTLQLQPDNMVAAKSRIGGLKPIVTPETFIARMKEWGQSEEKPLVTDAEADKALTVPATNDPETDQETDNDFQGIEV